ncbi:hypothetical protein [Haladaptatus sp. DFWS20]|uniref:hypothetical protein n=1 Tax=Haladaptatus sp. DFWS20 TaxID=3403467 RepID=UPI003EB836F4
MLVPTPSPSDVSKKYSQELARRTMDAMHELSKNRLGKIKRQRSKDGLSYQDPLRQARVASEYSNTGSVDGNR